MWRTRSALVLLSRLRLLRLLGGLMRAFGRGLPFRRELQPGLAVLVAQRAFACARHSSACFRKCSIRRFGTL